MIHTLKLRREPVSTSERLLATDFTPESVSFIHTSSDVRDKALVSQKSRASISRRLCLGFGTVLLLLLAVAFVSGLGMQSMSAQLRQITEVNAVKIKLARGLMNSINELAVHMRNVALFTDIQKIDQEVALVVTAKMTYDTTQRELIAVMASSKSTDQERAALGDIVNTSLTALPLIDKTVKQGSDGDNAAAVTSLTTQVQTAETQWRSKVAALGDMQERLSVEAATAANSSQQRSLLTMVLLVISSLALGAWVSWRITRSVTLPIQLAVRVAERIAQGDLTSDIEVHVRDETGRLLDAVRAMQERLRQLVHGILQTADSIQTASVEVATGNQDLSQRTELTASNLQQAAGSMEELTGTVHQSVEAAQHANTLAASAAKLAGQGGSVMGQVVSTMGQIAASSGRISDITSVIDSIAFQTNILALNAAVEAARAGEQGRGFAIVAGEVRNLAGRSAAAAKEIKGLISQSVERVQAGTTLVNHAGQMMTDIVDSVQRVSHIVGEMSSASSAQSEGIGQINSAVSQLDHMTQQNAALVEESAAAAESLKDQADQLTHMVGVFKL
jgi:methyl-accepting chemotaxis protein